MVLQLIRHPDCHALVCRQVADTLRDSVYAQILWAIDKLGLTAHFRCTQSPLQCTYLPTGQRILCLLYTSIISKKYASPYTSREDVLYVLQLEG